jgi:hypothetical protein
VADVTLNGRRGGNIRVEFALGKLLEERMLVSLESGLINGLRVGNSRIDN